jgi:hypothetical protein
MFSSVIYQEIPFYWIVPMQVFTQSDKENFITILQLTLFSFCTVKQTMHYELPGRYRSIVP